MHFASQHFIVSHFSKSWNFIYFQVQIWFWIPLFHWGLLDPTICVYVYEKSLCIFNHLAKTPFAQNHEEVEIMQPDSAFAHVQCSGSWTQSRRGHSRNRHHHSNRIRRSRGHESSIWYLQKLGERWDEWERESTRIVCFNKEIHCPPVDVLWKWHNYGAHRMWSD